MKKFLLLLVVLPLTTTILYSQREIVIETFDNWSGGLPEGYVWDDPTNPITNAVESIPGYTGSAIKLIDLNYPDYKEEQARRTIYYNGTFPDSISYYAKGSVPIVWRGSLDAITVY